MRNKFNKKDIFCRPNIDLFETTTVFVPYLACMDIDPLQDNKITTKLIWLIDHCLHFWIPAYICVRPKKDGNKRRNIAVFVTSAFGNSN